jgi:hypothetical protein
MAKWGGERLPDEELQPGGVYGLLTVHIPPASIATCREAILLS